MPTKFADHVKGATVHRIDVVSRTKSGAITETPLNPVQHVPAPLAKLLTAAGIVAPVAGTKLDLDRLDDKLAGQPIGRRLEIKAALRGAGMLE
jgi:hypothetical protein